MDARNPVRDALMGHRDDDEEIWRYNDCRMLLAEYGPEDEGLYYDPEAIGATRVEWTLGTAGDRSEERSERA